MTNFHYAAMDQPLDCRAPPPPPPPPPQASAAAAAAPVPGPSSSATASTSAAPPQAASEDPSSNQRLISAVYRMQYHPSMRPRMHPRHQRLWHQCQYQQELMRRHLGSAANSNPTPAHHLSMNDYASMAPPPVEPMPAHLGTYAYPMDSYRYMSNPYRFQPHLHTAAAAAAAESRTFPFLLQPVAVRGNFSEDYRRLMEQRNGVENSRGASKSCIERNTFPHKFKHIPREKGDNEDENDAVDKCTICLCGKLFNQGWKH